MPLLELNASDGLGVLSSLSLHACLSLCHLPPQISTIISQTEDGDVEVGGSEMTICSFPDVPKLGTGHSNAARNERWRTSGGENRALKSD